MYAALETIYTYFNHRFDKAILIGRLNLLLIALCILYVYLIVNILRIAD